MRLWLFSGKCLFGSRRTLTSINIDPAAIRRFPEVDFRTASAAGLAGLQDVAVLAMVAHEGHILVTQERQVSPLDDPQDVVLGLDSNQQPSGEQLPENTRSQFVPA